MAVVGSDVEALWHFGLTMTLMVDHNPHELTTVVVNLPCVEAKLHGESRVIQRYFDDNKDDNKR